MQNQNFISVIVPVYNVKPYLSECVSSILNQKYDNFELFLVDDGSTDGSGKLCDKLAENDRRIKVIHKKNGGLSSARNAGVEAAEGEYICFIDSDDMVSENYLEVLYENAAVFGADISICRFVRFEKENPVSAIAGNTPKELRKEDVMDRLTNVGTENALTATVAWNKLIRRSVAKNISFPPGKWHEDEFYINYLLEKSESFVETSAELYFYRQRSGSIVGSDNSGDLRHFDAVEAFRERVKLYKKIADKRLYRKMKKASADFTFFQIKKFLKAKI